MADQAPSAAPIVRNEVIPPTGRIGFELRRGQTLRIVDVEGNRVLVMTRRPGRCKEIVDVPFERPRTDAVVDSPEFIELRRYLWESLREEQTGVTDETAPAA